jgi:hypothetical protein
VPGRYQKILPLAVMKRYQCVVIGKSQGVLTVGITDRRCMYIFKQLGELTGCIIFPVLIDPKKMQLVLRRIERAKGEKHQPLKHRLAFHSLRSMLLFLTTHNKKQSMAR